jgi:2-phospho-L-lactate guanylyltransferase
MTTWAILPVKPFNLGKSRLHSFLDKEEIYQLNRNLFKSTYRRLEACHEIDKILVVTKDEEILKLVDEWGGVGLPENTSSSLNLAITQAFAYIQKSAESGPVLVIPADLPRMKTEDLDEMFAFPKENQFLVIVPDYNQTGTNALYMSRPALIKPMFGRWSFQKHIRQALRKSINLSVWLNKAVQYDLDTPQDLQKYNKINQYSIETIY